MNYKSLLVGIAIGIPMLVAGCGGSNVNNISIAITTAPPASLGVNQTASIAATVTMDSSNSGVDWSCTPTGTCGTFAPAHTASGATTVYTAPATAGAATIVATSSKKSTVTASASVTITNVNNISIAITTAPPASLEVNQTASIAATVTMDSSNSGVDWSCTPTGTCGTFAPAHTASGGTTVYTAPRTAGPVSIIAASTANSSKTASASVTINAVASASNLTGAYTFFVNGLDSNQNSYSVAGMVVLNGAMGTVTGGEQDYFDAFTPTIIPHDAITMGSIVVGADGRGTLTLSPATAPVETLSIAVVNNKHILITEFDAGETASGSLDLQTAPTSVPTGGNAFALLDTQDGDAFGGVLTSNGTLITASEGDDDLVGTADFDFAFTGSTFTAPNTNGRGTITLVDPIFGPFTLTYYVVGPEAFRLIEVDGVGFATGSMYGQGTGGFTAMSLGSKFVFGQSGIQGGATGGLGIYSAAGQFAGNGTTGFSSGVADVNLGDGSPVLAGSLTTGTTYFVNPDGYAGVALSGTNTDGIANFGVYLVDPAINVADPNSTSGGGGAVMLDLDSNNIGVGIVVPQATGPTFTGNFAFSDDGLFETATTFAYYGLVGQVTSDGSSKLAGLADYNELNTAQTPAVTITGTYAADATNVGRSTAQVTINGAATPNNLTLYHASSALVLHVDVDSTGAGLATIGLGVFEQQQ